MAQLSSDEVCVIASFLPVNNMDDWNSLLHFELTCCHFANSLRSRNIWKEIFCLNFPAHLEWIEMRYGTSPFEVKQPLMNEYKRWDKKHLVHALLVGKAREMIPKQASATANQKIKNQSGVEQVKMAVVGKDGSGKSTLVVRFIVDVFVETYDPTIEDSYVKCIEVDQTPLLLEILDTVSNEQFSYSANFFKETKVFIGVYDVTCEDSMDYLYHKMKQIAATYYPHVTNLQDLPFVIVETKADIDKYGIRYWDKFFSSNGKAYAKSEQLSFFDNFSRLLVSSKLPANVEQVFEQASRLYFKQRSPPPQVKKKKWFFSLFSNK